MTIGSKNIEYWQLLWLKFKSGDRESFEEIYQEFVDKLFAYGTRMTTDRELIKDCIHDLFIDLYRYNPDLRKPELIEFYLYKSLKRSIFKKLQKEMRLETIQPDYNSFELTFYAEVDGFQDNSRNEQIELLQKALKGLDERKRELLFLRFDSGLNYNEIGDLLDMKPETVKKQVYRIIQYLRDNFGSSSLELFLMISNRKIG